jgi:hypothetical protein
MRAPFRGRWRFGRDLLSTSVFAVLFLGVLAPSVFARDAYVANRGSNSVSVINTQASFKRLSIVQ